MTGEDASNVVHVEFPQHSGEPQEGDFTEVQLIEFDWLGLDAFIRWFLEGQGNELALRRIDKIEGTDLD